MSLSACSYRTGLRRIHRIIANHFAMRAWIAGADCVVIDRTILQPLLDLERIKHVRLEWIQADVNRWFPHVHFIEYVKSSAVGVLFLSRVPIHEYMTGQISDEQRVENMKQGGIEAIIFSDPNEFDLSEAGILSSSTLWAAGVKVPPKHSSKVIAPKG
jgi:hypothetical protein